MSTYGRGMSRQIPGRGDQPGGRHWQAQCAGRLDELPLAVQPPQNLQRRGQHLAGQRVQAAGDSENLLAGGHDQVDFLAPDDIGKCGNESRRPLSWRRHPVRTSDGSGPSAQLRGNALGDHHHPRAAAGELAGQIQRDRRPSAGDQHSLPAIFRQLRPSPRGPGPGVCLRAWQPPGRPGWCALPRSDPPATSAQRASPRPTDFGRPAGPRPYEW